MWLIFKIEISNSVNSFSIQCFHFNKLHGFGFVVVNWMPLFVTCALLTVEKTSKPFKKLK